MFSKNPSDKKTISVFSRTQNIRKVSSKMLSDLSGKGLDEATAFDIRLSVEEAVRNSMVHGNHSDGRLRVKVAYWVDGSGLHIEIEDEGQGFNHAEVADPTQEANMLKNSGRGVYLIRKLMDKVEYNGPGNKVTMTKKLG